MSLLILSCQAIRIHNPDNGNGERDTPIIEAPVALVSEAMKLPLSPKDDHQRDNKRIELKSISPKKRQREEGDQTAKPSKRPNIAEPGPSRTTIKGRPVQPSSHDLLVLPPMPMEMYTELTFSCDELDSRDSATEPETDTDEAERRKNTFSRKK